MSNLTKHIAGDKRVLPNEFYRAQPQVLRVVLQTLGRALSATISIIGEARIHEPRFTRQLLLDFQRARDNTPATPRYDLTHQPELPIEDATTGAVTALRRLDFRLLFSQQVGRTGDYLCLECKYLDTMDRNTDLNYVNEGVHRIVDGDYARNHPWAIMVGLERRGPLNITFKHINERLVSKYGTDCSFKDTPSIRLPNVQESEHYQAGGSHKITIVHAIYLIVPNQF